MSEKTAIEWQFEFPPEVQAEREVVLAALSQAMDEGTIEAVKEAGALAWDWVTRHPDDYVVWDAGEPIAMLAEALGVRASDPQVSPPARALVGTAAPR